MVQNNINDWPYYYWIDNRPTDEGRWYLRSKMAKHQAQVVLVKAFKSSEGTILCYLDVDCGWKRCEELSKEYWEWSSKPVPWPSNS